MYTTGSFNQNHYDGICSGSLSLVSYMGATKCIEWEVASYACTYI